MKPAIIIFFICLLVLGGFVYFNRGDKKPAYDLIKLTNEKDSLIQVVNQKNREYKILEDQYRETSRRDSFQKAQYEARILKDYYTLQRLQKNKDEKIKIIDTASDSLLWELLRAAAY